MAKLEEQRTLPFDAVWVYYCLKSEVPVGAAWLEEVRKYEWDVLTKR